MNISELIKILKKYQEEYGDIEVVIERMDSFCGPDDAEDITEVEVTQQFHRNVVLLHNMGIVE